MSSAEKTDRDGPESGLSVMHEKQLLLEAELAHPQQHWEKAHLKHQLSTRNKLTFIAPNQKPNQVGSNPPFGSNTLGDNSRKVSCSSYGPNPRHCNTRSQRWFPQHESTKGIQTVFNTGRSGLEEGWEKLCSSTGSHMTTLQSLVKRKNDSLFHLNVLNATELKLTHTAKSTG